MVKKNGLFILLFICMNLAYVGFVFGMKHYENVSSELPEISFASDLIEVDVEAGEEVLLEGVSATDDEDGNISDNIFVYGISSFDENEERTVTYAVFDSDDQLVTASRKLKYTNYTAPRFDSDNSLINMVISSLSGSGEVSVKASSCVDGDISNRISMSTIEKDDKVIYSYTVTDSTGTSSTIEIQEEFNIMSLFNNISIKLSDYIVYLNVGDDFDPESYIDTVVTSFGEQDELNRLVDIETNCNTSVAGQYEVKYTINRDNGDYGISKMIVIVE